VQVVVDGNTFRVLSRRSDASTEWVLHCSGEFACLAADNDPVPPLDLGILQARNLRPVERSEIYGSLSARGISYGETFQRIERLWHREGEVLARLVPMRAASGFCIHPALLDGCLQALYWSSPYLPSRSCYVPVGFQSIESFFKIKDAVWCRAF